MQLIAILGVGEKMENEVENTVEETQEDNKNCQPLSAIQILGELFTQFTRQI